MGGIRIANREDIPSIVKIFQEEQAKSPYNENWNEKDASRKIYNYYEDGCKIYVAEENGKIEGFAIASTFLWDKNLEGFIDYLIISEPSKKKGLGKKLMASAEAFFRERGIEDVALYTNRQAKAAAFFEKVGYSQGDMIIYSKKLT